MRLNRSAHAAKDGRSESHLMKLYNVWMAARQTVIQQLTLDVFLIEDSSGGTPVDEFYGNFQPSPDVQCMLNEAAASPERDISLCQEIIRCRDVMHTYICNSPWPVPLPFRSGSKRRMHHLGIHCVTIAVYVRLLDHRARKMCLWLVS